VSQSATDMYQILRESKEKALFDPEWFLRSILNEEPDPWQIMGIEVIADVHRKARGLPTKYNHKGLNRVTVRSCHGPGKTHWLAQIMHWWNYCFYARVVCTAPKEKQLKTRLWPRYRKILRGSIPGYRDTIEVTATEVKVANDQDWGCSAETASDPENMSGYHDEPQLFLVDEASARVLDPMFPVIEGTLTTVGSVLVIIGNPTRTSGEFHASHNKSGTKELYYRMHITPEQSRFIDDNWMKSMAAKYGKKSPVYLVRARGEFAGTEANQLIPLEWIEEAFGRERGEEGSIPRLRISVDVADGGDDETVVTGALHYQSYLKILKIRRFSFASSVAPIKSAEEGVRMFNDLKGNTDNGDDFVIDSIGVGAGTAGILIMSGHSVVTYKGGAASDDTTMWRNRRTQSYMVWRDGLRDGRIDIDENVFDESQDPDQDWDDYVAQMCSVHTKPGQERVEDLETKEELKRRNIKSPDLSDSSIMQVATQAPTIDPDNSVLTIFPSEVSNAAW